MTIYDLGFSTDFLGASAGGPEFSEQNTARVTCEFKERYTIHNGEKEYEAEILGNLRYSASTREDFPAVGDFVTYTPFNEGDAIINHVFPRKTMLTRQAVGKTAERQIIAANIDVAFIVQAVTQDFNVNRLERYLSVAYDGKVKPVLVLTKTDLVSEGDLHAVENQLNKRNIKIPVYFISNETKKGFGEFAECIEKRKAYCFLGSSGVGKTTIVNNLTGNNGLETKEISLSTGKGRHTTTHRELLILDNGGIIIDTPGMRELATADTTVGLEETFDQIVALAAECKYSDCTHTKEDGCAVLEAVDNGDLDIKTLQNYQKLKREKEHFQSTIAEKRRKAKDFGKMCKSMMREKNKNRF